MNWWHRDIIAGGKLPLMLCLVAFLATFLATRTVTRLIRSGRGPFRNHVSPGGVHVHHAVPGLLLLTVGAITAIGPPSSRPWRGTAAVLIGIGLSLVLDEYALILHLTDVYWSTEGRVSVDVVTLAAACLGLALIGFSPVGVDDVGYTEMAVRVGTTLLLVVHAFLVLSCVLKGKYSVALVGLFLPPVALVGAVRLARPHSPWARHRYGERREELARQRAGVFDARWAPALTRWQNLVGGIPSHQPDPAAQARTK